MSQNEGIRLPRVAILISGTGTNMTAIARAVQSGELNATIAFVGSDKASAKGLITAAEMGLSTFTVSYKEHGRAGAEKIIGDKIDGEKCDWIILAGYMRILSPDFVRRFKGRIINIHPALLPNFPGAHGILDAWNAGVKETGVTVHIVDEEVDHGPVLAQQAVTRTEDDTIETLESKIHAVEHQIYKRALKELFEKHPLFDENKGDNAMAPAIGIIMGSASDIPVVEKGTPVLQELGIEFEVAIASAHRTPADVANYARKAKSRGIKALIAVAGLSAALPGVVAAATTLPVIGVPVKGGAVDGLDALLSIAQMPPGVPAASVGLNGAKNACLMAARIVAASDDALTAKLEAYAAKEAQKVRDSRKKLETLPAAPQEAY